MNYISPLLFSFSSLSHSHTRTQAQMLDKHLLSFSFTPFSTNTSFLSFTLTSFTPTLLSCFQSVFVLLSFLFWKRYRYPPLFLNCRSRDSRPRRARLRGLPPATILPTQQQQGRFTSLIPKHLTS